MLPPHFFGLTNHVNLSGSVTLTAPKVRQIIQRDGSNHGTISVAGSYTGSTSGARVRARVVPRNGYNGGTTGYNDLTWSGSNFSGSFTATGGWYDLQIIITNGNTLIGNLIQSRVGVGEVFVTAGQSNATNYGTLNSTPPDDAVNMRANLSTNTWAIATNPQVFCDGTGGAPWPYLGNLLLASLGVPIGFVSTGIGGTSIAQWSPSAGNGFYGRISAAVSSFGGANSIRSVLWHQGENDAQGSTSTSAYVNGLQAIIAQIRTDAGWTVPWGIATATFITNAFPANASNISTAQQQVAANYSTCFQGANTDTLTGANRVDGTHFTLAGLQAHANLWQTTIRSYFSI